MKLDLIQHVKNLTGILQFLFLTTIMITPGTTKVSISKFYNYGR